MPAEKEETQRKPLLTHRQGSLPVMSRYVNMKKKLKKIPKKKKKKKAEKKKGNVKKEERLAAAAQRKGLRIRGGKRASLERGRGIKTRGEKQWHQSRKSLESGLSK